MQGATINRTAAVHLANKGKVNHKGGINAVAFEGHMINNARTYAKVEGGIENNKPIFAQLLGGGNMVNDSASINICTGPGDIVNNNSITAISGTPPPDWQPFQFQFPGWPGNGGASS